jgi:copper chaperone CopZ
VSVSLKSLSGVDSVKVNLENGLAAVKMKPGNTVTFKQLNEAIAKNGFTMKQSTATIAGNIVVGDGGPRLRVSGSNEMLDLVPDGQAPNATSLNGKSVVVVGSIPETAKGKSPDGIHYRSITEERTK